MVKEWHDRRTEAELDQATVNMELKAMAKKLQRYNMERLGEIPTERENGTMRVLVSQLGGCALVETREITATRCRGQGTRGHKYLCA